MVQFVGLSHSLCPMLGMRLLSFDVDQSTGGCR
jgi:hypothetical protein